MPIVISGPSGVGKDTIVEHLLEADPRLRYSVSYTTRAPRDYEVEGEHYSFLSREEFERMHLEGELLESATYGDNRYGTSRRRVEQLLDAGSDVILKIEVQGADQVRQRIPDGLFIFVAPPDMEELARRRHNRGSETAGESAQRQAIAEHEMSFAGRYDKVVVNDDLERVVAEILGVIRSERAHRSEAG